MWECPAQYTHSYTLGRWSRVIKQKAEQVTRSNPASSTPPKSLLEFLPPGSCFEFLPQLLCTDGQLQAKVNSSIPRLWSVFYHCNRKSSQDIDKTTDESWQGKTMHLTAYVSHPHISHNLDLSRNSLHVTSGQGRMQILVQDNVLCCL